MIKQIISFAAVAALVSVVVPAAAVAVNPTGAEECKTIQLSGEEIKSLLAKPDKPQNEVSIQEEVSDNSRASFYEYGSDYAYEYMVGMKNANELRRCYNFLADLCYRFSCGEIKDTICLPIDEHGNKAYTMFGNEVDMFSNTFAIDLFELQFVYYNFKHDHPEYYWLSGTVLAGGEDGRRVLVPTLFDEFSQYSERQKTDKLIDENFKRYTADIKAAQTESNDAAIKLAHDYICKATDYGYGADGEPLSDGKAHSIVSVLDGDIATQTVCEGYAKTLQLVLNAAGINNIYATGTANGGGHAWNLVEFGDNKYYYIDVTWDDRKDAEPVYKYYACGTGSFIGETSDTHQPAGPFGTGDVYTYAVPAVSEDDYSGIKRYSYVIDNISLKSTDKTEVLTEIPQDTDFYVEAAVAQASLRSEKACMILGIYDTDNVLISFVPINNSFDQNDKFIQGFRILRQEKEIGSIKIFMIDNFETMNALSKCGVVN